MTILKIIPTDNQIGGTQRVPAANLNEYAIADLIHIFKSDMYINEKGYLQKLVELLYNLGYYKDNKSIFSK